MLMNVWRCYRVALPTRKAAVARGSRQAEAWSLCGACVELRPGARAGERASRRRPYLVPAVPGARQRAVARAGLPVCEVPRQLVQDGRGVVLGARGHRRRHEDWLQARWAPVPPRPAAPLLRSRGHFLPGDRARAPGSRGAQVRSGLGLAARPRVSTPVSARVRSLLLPPGSTVRTVFVQAHGEKEPSVNPRSDRRPWQSHFSLVEGLKRSS
ncbi:hypothetical protein NN561_005890 [Cricetulus griseus]